MKTITEKQAETKLGKDWLEKALDDEGTVRCADHRESISEVLKSFDEQLKPHGLEITEVDLGSDTYYWFVSKKEKKS